MLFKKCMLVATCLISAVAHAAEQRALLIGISNYEADLVPLAGSRNDVQQIGELLISRFGFDPANIRTIVDENATRDKIFAAIRILSENADEDDIVFIHYSGHGSQAPDTNGDEEDGYDETILPYDSRTEGIADITDDELNELIGGFRAKSVIVVLDSCHSGTATRGGPGRVVQRWVAPDTRKHLYQSVATRQVLTLPISENHILFAAAQDSESELDGPFGPDNIRLGLFTAAMLGVLRDAQPTISPKELITGVHAQVERLKASAAGMPIPEPNLEAPLEKQDQPMFVSGKNPVSVTPPPPAVTALVDDPPRNRQLKSVFATMDGAPQPLLARRIAKAVDQSVRVARTIESADAVIDVVGTETFDVYGPAGVVKVASGLTGNVVDPAKSGVRGLNFLADVVKKAPALASFLNLDSSSSTTHIQLIAAGVPVTRSQQRSSSRAVKVSVNTRNHDLKFYQEGEARSRRNSLQIEVSSNEECFLTVASVDSFGDLYLLLPNSGQELTGFLPNGRIPANEPVLIPDSLASENNAGFHFDYSPPGGVDKVVAVCMKKLSDAEDLRGKLNKLQSGGPLTEPLLDVRSRGATGILPSQDNGGSGWAASVLTLTVGVD